MKQKLMKVSREVAEALDKQSKDDEWTQNFNLISHAKQFSGNGICMKNNWSDEFKVLNNLQPLEYAKCMLIGYEVIDE